jgi:hypothetical protein
MNALQADASAVPDDSVEHVANALVNMQVTAPAATTVLASTTVAYADRSAAAAAALTAAATVLASTLVDLADISVAAVWIQDTAALLTAAIVPASTLVDIADTKSAAVRARDSKHPRPTTSSPPRPSSMPRTRRCWTPLSRLSSPRSR